MYMIVFILIITKMALKQSRLSNYGIFFNFIKGYSLLVILMVIKDILL
jgi:hypothetical protein